MDSLKDERDVRGGQIRDKDFNDDGWSADIQMRQYLTDHASVYPRSKQDNGGR